jgi:hypothetical protein
MRAMQVRGGAIMRLRTLLLLAAIAASNLAWYCAYRVQDLAAMQEQGLRDEADWLLGKGGWYHIAREGGGQARVVCDRFGSLVVDCGTLGADAEQVRDEQDNRTDGGKR